jgi:hypothetical protein
MSDTVKMRLPEWVLDDDSPPDLRNRFLAACGDYVNASERADQLAAIDEMETIGNEARRRGVNLDYARGVGSA